MAVQQKRRTQTAEYWSEDLAVHKDDVTRLYEWLVEEGEPRTVDELSLRLIERRCAREEEALLKKSDKGLIYQPQERYEVGQRVVFPAYDYAAGQVVKIRDGHNPRYGPFRVIQVLMEGDDSAPREFAAEFTLDHPLNRSAVLLGDSEDLLSAQQLYGLYGQSVRLRLQNALLQSEDFVHFGALWFLRGLMPEVTPFHLNIAEAMIDERGQPLTVSQLLQEVELPSDSKISVRTYALNNALNQDPRFVETSIAGEPAWYLSDLIPEAIRHKPARLIPMYKAQGGEWLNRELRDFVAELGDEADELEQMTMPAPGSIDTVQFFLTYPHRREGTLPLTRKALGLLLEKPPERFMVTFLDQRSKEKMAGWMIAAHNYAWGLDEWYQHHGIPIGALVELCRGEDPYTFLISCEEGKRKSEWIREAKVFNGQLTFGVQRRAYACRYDKYLLMDEGTVAALDRLWMNASEDPPALFEYLTQVFPELAKLSGQGLVHAKTLYSAVNLTRRCGAVPIFAELTRRACFDPVGDGNWVYDESLRNVTYNTPEEMRRRPSSRRQDMIVDNVYRYGMSSEVGNP